MSTSSSECVTTQINTLRSLFKDGYTQQALTTLSTLESSLHEHIEHIDYSDHKLPA